MTFKDFIQSCPGLERYAVNTYLTLDEEASRLGAAIAATRDPKLLRSRAAISPRGLRDINNEMADALERDPSGRLAAVPSLRAWASGPAGIGPTWVNWYVRFLDAWIDAQAHDLEDAA